MGRESLLFFSFHKSLVTRISKKKKRMGRGSLTVLLLPQVTGDQEWEEEREDGQGILTVLLLPQVTDDQEREEEGENMGRNYPLSCHKTLLTRSGNRREIRWAEDLCNFSSPAKSHW